MLEGKEVDQKFDNGAGELVVDVDDKGGVLLSASYDKDLDGYGKAEISIKFKTNVFTIAEKIAAKTSTTWDDAAIKGLEQLLGVTPGQAPVPSGA